MTAETLRDALFRLTGAGRPTIPPIYGETSTASAHDGYVVERLTLVPGFAEAEAIRALFARPDGVGPWPAVLYCHAHGGRYPVGKSELVEGRSSLQAPAYAKALTERGIAALCLDMPCFEDRQQPGESHRAMALLWRGKTLFGLMLDELMAGIDYLQSRPDVDADRIATVGLSMGCTHAWWVAALDDRVCAVASLCCLADMETLVSTGGHDLHGLYMVIPGLVELCATGEIAALIAPRPHLSCVGLKDPLTPPDAVDKVDKTLKKAYRSAGAPDNWTLLVDRDAGHQETPAMREEVIAFLAKQLSV